MQEEKINCLIVKDKSFISYVLFVYYVLISLYLTKIKIMTKRAKNIHLSESAIRALSIKAVEQGSNFKNYVETILENLANQKKKAK